MNNENWTLKNVVGDEASLINELGIGYIMARTLVNRGMDTPDKARKYLYPSINDLYDGSLLYNAFEAALLLKEKIINGKTISIIGDYDVDGITSTYLLKKHLNRFAKRYGAKIYSRIPHRVLDGYGINKEMINEAIELGTDTIITCDNGISAFEAVAYAKECNLSVIITDHHEVKRTLIDGKLQDEIPVADIVVNQNLEADKCPNKHMCGALTAYKVIECLYKSFEEKLDKEKDLLMLSLATVCDVMPLEDENRMIYRLAMDEYNKNGEENTGLKALIKTALKTEDGETMPKLSCYSIGHVLGPCINATGRLESADLSLELLEEENYDSAVEKAQKLIELNAVRKDMTIDALAQAVELIEKKASEKGKLDDIIVVYMTKCHESLAGILAGRIREKYQRPSFVFTGNDILKGSARSITAYSLYEELTKVSDLMIRFGGHPMAAGVSINSDKLEEFTEALNEKANLKEEDFKKKIVIDGVLPFDRVGVKDVLELAMLEPFGKGNEKVIFAERDCLIKGIRYIGKNNNYLRFRLQNSFGKTYDASLFKEASEVLKYLNEKFGQVSVNRMLEGKTTGDKISIAYVPQYNCYNGVEKVQCILESIS
ncbi:MAG: single-stranded-DNA-specific exonuclease RecJ [Lachnospiraceae bacterium]|nr:single-stranded-DNA-specific exonuclease RecJ [Lachnospiraceae bacterium]